MNKYLPPQPILHHNKKNNKGAAIFVILVIILCISRNSYAQHPWLIKDVNPTNASGNILNDGTIIGANGSDGSIPQQGIDSFGPIEMYTVNGAVLYFGTDGKHSGIIRTNGTKEGTSLTAILPVTQDDENIVTNVYNAGSLLYFTFYNGDDFDLYRTDGTAAGTFVVFKGTSQFDKYGEIRNFDQTSPYVSAYNGNFYFSTGSDNNAAAIFVTDGTVAGTKPVLTHTDADSLGYEVTAFNNKLFYLYNSGASAKLGKQLYSYDLNTKAKNLVCDLSPDGKSVKVYDWVNMNDKYLVINAYANKTFKILSLDATGNCPATILDKISVNTTYDSENASLFYGKTNNYTQYKYPAVIYKNKLFFTAATGSQAIKTYVTNGETAGTYNIGLNETNFLPLYLGTGASGIIFRDNAYNTGEHIYLWNGDSKASYKALKGPTDSLTAGHYDPLAAIQFNNKILFLPSGSSTIAMTDTAGSYCYNVAQALYSQNTGALLNNSYIFLGSTINGFDAGDEPYIISPDNWSIWTGKTSSAWPVATNWLDNTVPTAASDVIIPTVKLKPLITTTVSAKSITTLAVNFNTTGNYSPSHLTINKPGSLSITGYMYDSGFITGTGALNIVGTGSSQVNTYQCSYNILGNSLPVSINVDTVNIKGADWDMTNVNYGPNELVINSIVNFQSDNKLIANTTELYFYKYPFFKGYNSKRFVLTNRYTPVELYNNNLAPLADTIETLPIGSKRTSYSPISLLFDPGVNDDYGTFAATLADTVFNNSVSGKQITSAVVGKMWKNIFLSSNARGYKFGWQGSDQEPGFNPANSWISNYSSKWVRTPHPANSSGGIYNLVLESDGIRGNTFAIFSTPSSVITFNKTDTVTYGTGDLIPGAKSTNTTTDIAYTSSDTTIATVVASKIHVKKAGIVSITASQAGNSSFGAATPVTQTLTVNKAPLIIKANDQTGIQGTPLPALTVSYTGFVNGDTEAGFNTQPTVSTTAKSTSAQGYYPITVSGGSSANYTFSYAAGTITVVTQAYLQAPITQTYGATDFYTFGQSTTNVTYSSSNAKVLTVATNGLIHIVGAGTADITFGSSSGHLTKTVTINKAPLTIKANDQTGIQGTPLPALTLSYTGFVNGDTQTGFTTQPTVSTTAKSTSGQGYYPITVSGGSSANYIFSYTPGTLTMVTQAYLQAPLTKTYGNADFYVFGAATDGVTYISSNLKVATITSTGLVHIVGAGTITITFGNSSGHLTKALTVNPAVLTVTAQNVTKKAGDANPPLPVIIGGFISGESPKNLTTVPYPSTTATTTSPAGSYPITVGHGAATNYTFVYTNATLTVTASQIHSLVTDVIPEPQVKPGISPNGDGVNDVLTITNIENYPDNKLTLIDRNGAKIYEVKGYNNSGKAFNGTSNINGKRQADGTYFYQLVYKVNSVMKSETGYIVVKR